MVDGFVVGDQQADEHVDPLEAELDREVEEAGKVQEALPEEEQVEIQTEELEKDKDRQQEDMIEEMEEKDTGEKSKSMEGVGQKPEEQAEKEKEIREKTPETPEKVAVVEVEEEKTPVIQRTEQWKVKGTPVRRGRGRGGGRGRGRGRGNKRSKQEVETVDSDKETEPEKKREKIDSKKNENTTEIGKKNAPKRRPRKKTEKPGASDDNKNDEDKEPKLVLGISDSCKHWQISLGSKSTSAGTPTD